MIFLYFDVQLSDRERQKEVWQSPYVVGVYFIKSGRTSIILFIPQQALFVYFCVYILVRKVDHLTQSDRWRRQQLTDKELQAEVTPNNILLVGPSGCGKTVSSLHLGSIIGMSLILLYRISSRLNYHLNIFFCTFAWGCNFILCSSRVTGTRETPR